MATFPTLSPFFIPRPAPALTSSALHRHHMVMVQHPLNEEKEGPPLTAITSSLSSSSSSTPGTRSRSSSQLVSLVTGRWVKLICGASFEDVAHVRNLSLVYTLAGVDCIDCAADPSIVAAVREGIDSALNISADVEHAVPLHIPWVMVSINDDTDLHFRKAEFVANECPSNCSRPCERVCPASAIWFNTIQNQISYNNSLGGVLTDRCYGCGRCIPVCPFGLIGANSYVRDPEAASQLFESKDVDAVEIHTTARNLESFKKLWERIHVSAQSLKLIAV